MEIEKQLVCIELSMKLKKLGVKQDSLFCWKLQRSGKYRLVYEEKLSAIGFMGEIFSAFTVAELGEMLNKAEEDNLIKAYEEVFEFKGTGQIGLLGVMVLIKKPDMLAKMLIYLIENKLIEI